MNNLDMIDSNAAESLFSSDSKELKVNNHVVEVEMPRSLQPYHDNDIQREYNMSKMRDDKPDKCFWKEQKVLGESRWYLIGKNYVRVTIKPTPGQVTFFPRWRINEDTGILEDQYKKYFPLFFSKQTRVKKWNNYEWLCQ